MLANNDKFIRQILKDKNYIIMRGGKIFTYYKERGHIGTKLRLAGSVNSYGYDILKIYFEGKKRNIAVHRIIYAKYGSKPLRSNLVVNHKDGNRLNNSIDNLELVTWLYNRKYRA